jgi:hypothetical protein
MGSIIEMAARNELLRRDGRLTAHEFLERIESHLESRQGPPGDPRREDPGPGDSIPAAAPPAAPSWSTLMPQASSTESSAWIPAMRPKAEGKE